MSVMLSQPPLAEPVGEERREPGLKLGSSFEPRIIGLVCNWCSYAGADLAGTSRIQYPPNIRLVRVMCTGSVDPLYILRPLMDGADGVLVGG